MNLRRIRLIATILMCIVGFGLLGGLLGWVLHVHLVLAAVTLGLVVVGTGLVWWKWGSTREARRRVRGIRRRLLRAWAGVEGLQLRVLSVLLAVAAVSSLVAILMPGQKCGATLLNSGIEMTRAFVTCLLLQWVIGYRERSSWRRRSMMREMWHHRRLMSCVREEC